MKANRYEVTLRQDPYRQRSDWTEIEEAYTAADAIVQAELRWRGSFPAAKAVKVQPASETAAVGQ